MHEINFINTLEADNMKHDLMARHHDYEQRVQSLAVERQKKSEDKAAKEAKAEERRRIADAERAQRLRELAEKKRIRQQQLGTQRSEHERERLEAAKLKREYG